MMAAVSPRRAEDVDCDQNEEAKAEDPEGSTSTAGIATSGSVPAREETVAEHVFKLKELKPNMPPPWAFIARVIAKNPVREWKTWQDAGTLLEVYVADTLHGCTRVTIFNEYVDSYQSVVTPGTTCYFSGGRVKRAFSSSNTIEISFGSGSDIRRVPDIPVVPQLFTVRLADLSELADGATSSTIAVVHALGGLKRLLTKKGKHAEKREILLVDDSGYSIVCTTWNQLARGCEDVTEGTILVVKAGILSTYNKVRSTSIGIGSEILHEPALARADQLREWYSAQLPNHDFTPLASP